MPTADVAQPPDFFGGKGIAYDQRELCFLGHRQTGELRQLGITEVVCTQCNGNAIAKQRPDVFFCISHFTRLLISL